MANHDWQRGDQAPSDLRAPGGLAGSPRRGPKNYQRSDERIYDDIHERLTYSDHIDASDVTVEVKGGKVTLYGTVAHRQMKHWIEDIVAACSGVNEVENKLSVALVASWPPDRGRV